MRKTEIIFIAILFSIIFFLYSVNADSYYLSCLPAGETIPLNEWCNPAMSPRSGPLIICLHLLDDGRICPASINVCSNLGLNCIYPPFGECNNNLDCDDNNQYTTDTCTLPNTSLSHCVHQIADSDGDGIPDLDDICPNTELPENFILLLPNHYASVDNWFFYTLSMAHQELYQSVSDYTLQETKGCSCKQILEYTNKNGNGEEKFGCLEKTITDFIENFN